MQAKAPFAMQNFSCNNYRKGDTIVVNIGASDVASESSLNSLMWY